MWIAHVRRWVGAHRWVTTGIVVLVAGLGVWLLWPSGAQAPQARQYTEFTACLLTDDHGITGTQAAPVWAGLQDASLTTHAQAEYLPIDGEQSQANAALTLGTLVRWRCDLIFAVGAVPVTAVEAGAKQMPAVRFFVVGGSGRAHDNITYLNGDPKAAVRDAFTGAVADQ